MAYNLNQLAMITGLTTRTLRNHLKAGVLTGEKIDGNWQFTEEALDDYIGQPNVRRAIAARQHAVIYDFLADAMKKTNRICVVMDFPVAAEAAMAIAAGFIPVHLGPSRLRTETAALTAVEAVYLHHI